MSAIEKLIEALTILPGVGPKSAQRMALQLLQSDRSAGLELAQSLDLAMRSVRECAECRNFTEADVCHICRDENRDATTLCVVESPADVLAIETAGGFKGYYFVLHGRLSPLDGIGPEELGVARLFDRVGKLPLEEIVLATNPTVEGEATAHYIAQATQGMVAKVSRIAHGVPLGGEIEYTDGGTLAHAIQGRRTVGS